MILTCRRCEVPLNETDLDAGYCTQCGVDTACPQCGGLVLLDVDAEMETTIYRQAPGTMPFVERVRVRVPVAFCMACEFSLEVR